MRRRGSEMDFFWEMLSLQETLFLLILLGVLVKKLKIIRENGRKTLSDLLIYAILPCNIVASFMGGSHCPMALCTTAFCCLYLHRDSGTVDLRKQAAVPPVSGKPEKCAVLWHDLFQFQLCRAADCPSDVRGSGCHLYFRISNSPSLYHVDSGSFPIYGCQ